jgi:CheY-like chemotaxis protein
MWYAVRGLPSNPALRLGSEIGLFDYTGIAKIAATMTRARKPPTKDLELARVLLVDDDIASRLTLKTVLEAGGYFVDAAASAAEAVGKLDEQQYALVLSDLQMESPEAGLKVLAHARLMDYKPATALLTTYQNSRTDAKKRRYLISPEDLPDLLSKIADLISSRAARIVERQMTLRQA